MIDLGLERILLMKSLRYIIMILDERIRDEKLLYNINRKAIQIAALSSDKINIQEENNRTS